MYMKKGTKLKKVRKIVFTIYLIALLFIAIMFFMGLTDESFQPVVTYMIRRWSWSLIFTSLLFCLLGYIYRKK